MNSTNQFNRTRTSIATMRTKTRINLATQGTLPCPTHPQFNISHVCVSPNCTALPHFCSECLFDNQSQQHLARHKDHVLGWADLMILCRRQSVAGRLGDEPQKELNQIVLQTQAHQQSFKNYMKSQEQAMASEFDNLTLKFTEMINRVKQDLMAPYKVYLADLQDMGSILERLVSDYYMEKNKDYNNDFDNFLSEVSKLQEQADKTKPQFNLRKLMQNIIPLVSKANSQFQRVLQQNNTVDENQTSVTGLTLFSSMALKQSDNQVLADLVNEYKTLLNQRPQFKNQGLAQQTYSQINEFIEKSYFALTQTDFLNPTYKSQLSKLNKENVSVKSVLSSPKGTKFIETVIKEQTNKQLKQTTKNEEEEDELRELKLRHQLRNQTQLQIPEQFTQLTHLKSIKTTHKQGINCMVQVDEDFIATGSNDRTVKIYRYRVYELYKEVAFKSDITSLAVQIRKDGSSFLLVGLFKDVAILNQAFEVVRTFEKIHTGQINQMVALEDSLNVFSCAQNDNRLIQLNIQNEGQKKYFEHRDAITSVVMLNETHLASGGKDRNIKVYRLMFNNNAFEKLQLSVTLQDAHQTEVTALASGGSQYLFSSCASGELKVWDYQDGVLLKQVKNFSGWCYKIIYFYFEEKEKEQQQQKSFHQTLIGSPKRKKQIDEHESFKSAYLATVSFDGTIKVFSGKTIMQQDNPTPVIQGQLKSLVDCHPFGGVVAIRDSITDKLELLSCGNKNDNNIQLYSLS